MTAPLHDHGVSFYDVDDELVTAVTEYAARGLSAGERVILIATEPHRDALDAALALRGTDTITARVVGTYVALDAAETLESFMVAGSPDAAKFADSVGAVVAAARADGAPVRAFGEMVALLWDLGNAAGAIELESLWNDLLDRQRFSLLCAYPTSALGAAELAEVHDVCRLHSAVSAPGSYLAPASPGGFAEDEVRGEVFLAVPEAVGAARQFVTATLRSWGQGHLVGDGALIISELATNAVVHGDSPFRVSIARSPLVVRITVEDAGPGLPQRSIETPSDAVHGRGVDIVAALARRWGCDPLPDSKLFWAELEAEEHGVG